MEVLLAALLARQVSGDAAGKSMDWAVNFEIYYCVTHCRGDGPTATTQQSGNP